MSDISVKLELDCRGLNCPMPILKTKKSIEGLASGEVLKLISTDPGTANDLDAWSKRTGNPILKTEKEGGDYIFFVRKK